ncbi:hypothetical protein GC163_20980 [bacterium]|nr:hypothetical protein [bacterium]
MQLMSSQQNIRSRLLRWSVVWIGLTLLLASWPAAVLSQDPWSAQSWATQGAQENSELFGSQYSGRSGQAFGSLIRGGFVTGPGIGREDSFAPVEFMPYAFIEDGMVFGDLRGFRSTQDKYGANVGLGYRQYVRSWDRILGVNFFYDYDNTSTQLFRQYGFGLETLGSLWDMRLNTYFPTSQDTKQLSLEFLPDSIRYSGNNILYDQLRTFGVHMKGLDHELAVPLPGRFSERHDVRGVVGWYHFEGRNVDQVWGWKGRIEGDLISNVHMGLEVTNDSVFDTNVVFQVAVSYGGFKQNDGRPTNQFNRMTTPIQRQYTAVVQRVSTLESDLVALKANGDPYFVEHVASADPYDRTSANPFGAFGPTYDPTAPLGSYENPFLTIDQAQAQAGGDIIFTWTNSQFDNMPIVAESGVQTLGEADGVNHTVLLQPFGFVDLPRAINNPDPTVPELRPLLTNIVGDAITLTSGAAQPDGSILRTEVSGFRVGDENDPSTGPTGNGIFGDNVTAVDADFNQINYAALDGILLNNVGDVAFFNTSVLNARGTGFHVDGGTPRVTFEGDGDEDPTIRQELQYNDTTVTGGQAVIIENTNAGSFVDLFGTSPSTIIYDNAGGILIQNNTGGSARFGDVVITNEIASGNGVIEIFNNSGAYTFASAVNLDGILHDGLYVNQLQSGGQVTFQNTLDVSDRIAYGLHLFENEGNVLFIDDVTVDTDGTVATSNDPALSYLRSSGNVTFRGDVVLELGNGLGIEIGENNANPDNTGTFTVNGDTSILGFADTSLLIIEDDSTVNFGAVAVNARGAEGVVIDQQRGNVTFSGLVNVSNSAGSNQTGVVLVRNTNVINFSSLSINGASSLGLANFTYDNLTQPVPIAGLAALNNPGTIRMGQLNIDSVFGAALYGRNVGVQSTDITTATGGIFTNGGTLDSTFEAAVDIDTSVIGLAFDSVSATQSARQGIRLVNNDVTGRAFGFQVDPGVDTAQAGGAIIQSALEGALFQNTGNVSLRAQDYIQNGLEGIHALNVIPQLLDTDIPTRFTGVFSAQSMNIIQSGEEGIQTDNVLNVSILNSVFTQNGGFNDFAEILIQSSFNPDDVVGVADYVVTLDLLDLTETGSDAIRVLTQSGGEGSTLDLSLTNSQSQITLTAGAGDTGLSIDWSGGMTVFVDNNLFQFFPVLSGGIEIFPRDLFALADITITNNAFQGTSAGVNDINIQTLGPSQIFIDNNSFNNSGFASISMFLSLNADSNTTITNNIITDAGDQSVGVRFQSIEAPASVTLFGNDFLFTNNDLFFDERGFDFLSTTGQIDFFGSDAVNNPNNIVTIDQTQGAGFPWFNFPINGLFTGSVLVNGSLQP